MYEELYVKAESSEQRVLYCASRACCCTSCFTHTLGTYRSTTKHLSSNQQTAAHSRTLCTAVSTTGPLITGPTAIVNHTARLTSPIPQAKVKLYSCFERLSANILQPSQACVSELNVLHCCTLYYVLDA